MKKVFFSISFCLIVSLIVGQLPNINLKDVNGNTVNLSKFSNDGKPIIINFWATWCKPCKLELNTIADEYDDWVEETGVRLIAVSIDDSRSSTRVEPYINAHEWEYLVLLDPNGDLKRAMNVNNVPHTFLISGAGKIIWNHNNYSPGDENELYEELVKLTE
tara:strand:+ start:304 stop:786 length:483 start_codon:yes stop_codon:yes gene_type:complete